MEKRNYGHKNGKWKGGVAVNTCHSIEAKTQTSYLRISAGPFRGWYVHELIAWAKIGRPLEDHETVDHLDGDGMNCHPDNLEVVTKAENTRRMIERHTKAANERQVESGGVSETSVEAVR